MRRSGPAGPHHVRAQLRSYEPSRLHQVLKLYCSKCCTMYGVGGLVKVPAHHSCTALSAGLSDPRQDVPDDELLEDIFSQASRNAATCEPPPWALSGAARLPPGPSKRTLGVHVSKQLVYGGKTRQLIFIMGKTLMILFIIVLVLMEPPSTVRQGLLWRKHFTSLLATRMWSL